ncbi:MAG TPA: quinoprotein dehydrogenase-associated putative ABC transporter substrate-binding protein [Acetobacteraceae bacterium]|jgi:quinoprotein dehydrogenase-associated probable ABC transporter substrate-binding protein|nr:quinoprotein dehydrogenase-associated putative ABC transporter substrate-binding protein [Acetobacteraceae bacterium]
MPRHTAVTAAYRRTIQFHSELAAIAVLLLAGPAMAQAPGLGLGAELVDPHVLRVCADPNDLPFSNQAQQGFENRIAAVLAQGLGKTLGFTWQPQVFGFLQLTLDDYRCDVVMGITQGNHEVENSNAYYRSAYALIYRPHSGFDGMQSLEDKRLQGKRIGIVAGTPPATILAENGLLDHVHAYQLSVNLRYFAPARDMTEDLENDKIDAGVLWGPIAGYFASRSDGKINIAPLLHESDNDPPMAFSIVMGVRHGEDAWRRQLNAAIASQQPAITKVLESYGVPLLDDRNHLIYAGG